jgi:HK97 family phage major capsid protein
MSEHLKRLVEEQNKLFNRMQEIQGRTETENRDWTAEERTNWDEANARIDVVSGDIDRLERSRKYDSVDLAGVVDGVGTPANEGTPEERTQLAEQAYTRAFSKYVRGGREEMEREDRQILQAGMVAFSKEDRAQFTTTPAAGGYLIPPGYRAIIIERLKAFGGLLEYAEVITTATGNNLQWPTVDDTANVGTILAEGVAPTMTDFVFGTASLNAYLYASGIAKVSVQLLQDSVFNLDTWLPQHLGTRLSRGVAPVLVTGTGSSQPLGVATNATASVTGADQTSITYDNLIDLEHSLDPAYRTNCRFMMSDAALAVIRKIKDSQGHPLWVPVPVPGMAPTINGNPYFIDQGMAVPGASAKSILFGNFQEAYVVRMVRDMQIVRFDERFMDQLEIGFLAFMRLDATLQNTNAVAAFQHHS